MHFPLLVGGSDVAFVDDESSSAIAFDRTIFSFQAFIWKVDQVFIELWLKLDNIAFFYFWMSLLYWFLVFQFRVCVCIAAGFEGLLHIQLSLNRRRSLLISSLMVVCLLLFENVHWMIRRYVYILQRVVMSRNHSQVGIYFDICFKFFDEFFSFDISRLFGAILEDHQPIVKIQTYVFFVDD